MSLLVLLRNLLGQPHLSGEKDRVLVLDIASGEDPEVDELATPDGPFRLCRVSSELALRHELWKAGEKGLVAFVSEPLAREMPADLLLSARNQRVQVLTANEVLSAVLGATVTGASHKLGELAMAHLDELRQVAERTFPSAVDGELLTELLLEACGESRVLTEAPGTLLAAWIEERPSWDGDLTTLIRNRLARRGAAGRVLAWALEEVSRLDDVVTYGAVLSVDSDDLAEAAWGPFAAAEVDVEPEALRSALTELAGAALAELGSSAERLLRKADSLAIKHLKKGLPETSRLLRVGFSTFADKLAHKLTSGATVSLEEVGKLREYLAATSSEIRVIEEMSRLSRWLSTPVAEVSDILGQVREYQGHGAFADVSARVLLEARSETKLYQSAIDKVLARYRARRDAANLRFATTLASDYEASMHARGLHPLHRVTGDLLRPGLDEGKGFYCVILDGCSYPVFLELLHELVNDRHRPIGLVQEAGDTMIRGLPSLVPLPSITSHSRGAIFLGKVPKDKLVAETRFREQEEAVTDKARFSQNESLGNYKRVLFLKGDLTDDGEQLRRALRDHDIGLVAAVFNAVDDQIGSANTGAEVRLRAGQIKAFKSSLDVALEAGRRILLTADHGHTPFIDKELRRGAKSPSRYVELGEQDDLLEGFLEIDLAGMGYAAPKKMSDGTAQRVAFAWQSGVYRGKQQAGFHGGCSLEEMVVPLAWLCPDGLNADRPLWWNADVLDAADAEWEQSPEPRSEEVPSEPASEEEVVAELPSVSAPEPQIRLFGPENHGLPNAVWESLGADERKVLDFLRLVGDARVSAIASETGKPLGRVPGFMSRLSRRLGVHSRFDRQPLPGGEQQYRYKA